ncbi:MAG TPA: iron-containing redox enzyme family protein [Chloroflexota bacterium]|nr:iron-containing redox enzyme family protein [Chloroflexota bacterium]
MAVAAKSAFRMELEGAVLERHCANHPLTEKWARGELGRRALMGWAVEHWHWITQMPAATFYRCAQAPEDVRRAELANRMEEDDPRHSHRDIVLRFAAANGADVQEVKAGRGLPTTEAWASWLVNVARHEHWIASVAANRVGTESQSPLLYSKVLPALRDSYKFREEDIEHFWLHSEVDVEHGDRGFELLEQHCATPELREMAIHFARESAKMRWFYFDGIYLHYEMGYSLR